jgi:hypothetical protein
MENSHETNNSIINEDDNLVGLLELLEEIDENKSAARLNEISMIDSEGRRIFY